MADDSRTLVAAPRAPLPTQPLYLTDHDDLLRPPRRLGPGRAVVALFFVVLLLAGTAYATAILVDARGAGALPGAGTSGSKGANAAQLAAAVEKARTAGYKQGLADAAKKSKAATTKAKKDANKRIVAAKASGIQQGKRVGFSEGFASAQGKYTDALAQANAAAASSAAAAASAQRAAQQAASTGSTP